jgi:cysteine desulfuration protein SufE
MADPCCSPSQYGSEALDRLADRLNGTPDPRKRYEYVLWLAKKLPVMPTELQTEDRKVQGCVSQVFIHASLQDNFVCWQGESDALITKGLLALLIKGMSDLTPDQVLAVNPAFIAATGLQASLTPSRANGFLNILRAMQSQALALKNTDDATDS